MVLTDALLEAQLLLQLPAGILQLLLPERKLICGGAEIRQSLCGPGKGLSGLLLLCLCLPLCIPGKLQALCTAAKGRLGAILL